MEALERRPHLALPGLLARLRPRASAAGEAAGEVERAEDELVTLSRSLIGRLATRIAGLNVEEIPVDSIPRWLKVVGDLELKALGRGDL